MSGRAAFDADECSLRFDASGAKLFLNPDDNRAAFLIRKRGVSQQALFDCWTGILERLRPDAIVDIGANYGEMFLPRRLAEGCELRQYEANPGLLRYLERSCAAHPDHPRAKVFAKGVSDREGTLRFFADLKWSGTSSFDFRSPDGAYKGEGEAAFREVEVPVCTLDAALAELRPDAAAVAVKIDTEGHEPRILAAGRTLTQRRFALVMEAQEGHLRRAGSSLRSLLGLAAEYGSVFRIAKDGRFAPAHAGSEIPSCDLLVTNDDSVIALANAHREITA